MSDQSYHSRAACLHAGAWMMDTIRSDIQGERVARKIQKGTHTGDAHKDKIRSTCMHMDL